MRDRQAQSMAERGRESAAQRKARKKAQAQAHGEGRRLVPSTEEGGKRRRRTRGGEYEGGWSMLGTLIRYKRGQLREQRVRENGAGGRAKEGGSDDAQQGGVDGTEGEQTVVTEEGVRSDVSTRIQQEAQGSGVESENMGFTGNEDTEREESSGVRVAQAEDTQRTPEEEGIMTQEEMEELERARIEAEEMVSSEQWAEEVAREMEHEIRGEEDAERTAQAAAGPSTCAHESRTTETQESEEESMRTDQHGATQQAEMAYEEEMVVEDDVPQQEEQQEEEGEHGAHTPQLNTPTVASDAASQHLETFLASAAVNDGREGRVLRGAGKRGGYDEITRRERPRKRTGPRIRYVDEDERGGGTTEQGIRVGPVCVYALGE